MRRQDSLGTLGHPGGTLSLGVCIYRAAPGNACSCGHERCLASQGTCSRGNLQRRALSWSQIGKRVSPLGRATFSEVFWPWENGWGRALGECLFPSRAHPRAQSNGSHEGHQGPMTGISARCGARGLPLHIVGVYAGGGWTGESLSQSPCLGTGGLVQDWGMELSERYIFVA